MTVIHLPAGAPATVRETCVCLHLQRAARAVGRLYDAAFRPLGLTHEQFSLLMMLARPEAPSIGVLAAELVLDRTTLTANLKPLARQGWLVVAPDPLDRRSRRVHLTSAGRALLAEALPRWRSVQRQASAARGRVDWPALREGLHDLAAIGETP
jgi:DNA-binding MarR family transcriptional regulator